MNCPLCATGLVVLTKNDLSDVMSALVRSKERFEEGNNCPEWLEPNFDEEMLAIDLAVHMLRERAG